MVVLPAPRRPSSAMTGSARSPPGPLSSSAGVVPSARGQAGQLADRDVRLARLDLDEEALGEPGAAGQLAQGGPALRAQRAHALAQAGEQAVGVHVVTALYCTERRNVNAL